MRNEEELAGKGFLDLGLVDHPCQHQYGGYALFLKKP